MSIRNSNYGLSGILEGSTESEIQKERNARIKVSRQLGISLEEFEQQLQPKNLDQETPMDALLYVSYPKTKYNPADVAVKASVAVKDKFGNTAAEKKRMIDKYIVRKPIYPFHTVKNIDFATKTLKEESVKKLTPQEEKKIDDLNRDLKRDALKSEIADLVPWDDLNSASYPSDPIQGARLKNIDSLEKSLAANKKIDFKLNTAAFESANPKKDDDDHPYMKHKMEQLEEIQKEGKSWLVKHLKKEDEKQSRVNAQLTKLKKHGENPLVAAAAKLPAAGKANTTGAKYIPKEQRIYESLKLQGYETPEKSDRSFAKLEADRALDDERSKRRNARFI